MFSDTTAGARWVRIPWGPGRVGDKAHRRLFSDIFASFRARTWHVSTAFSTIAVTPGRQDVDNRSVFHSGNLGNMNGPAAFRSPGSHSFARFIQPHPCRERNESAARCLELIGSASD